MSERPWVRGVYALLAAAVAAAAVWGAGHVVVLAPAGPLFQPGWLTALGVIMLAGSLYRPSGGGSLGLGAAGLPPLIVLSGAVPAAWVAGAALLFHEPACRSLARLVGVDPTPRRPLTAAPADAAAGALAALAAGAAWSWLAPGTTGLAADPFAAGGAAAAVFLYLLTVTLAGGGARWLMGMTPPWGPVLRRLPLDLAGWGLGVALALTAVETNGALVALLAAGFAALAFEAARKHLLYRGLLVRLTELDRVRQAGQRMVASRHELASVADRIRLECAEVVPFHWFQLELLAPTEEYQSWWSGPEGVLREGEPEPDPAPPPLPGMHRRTSWEIVERNLFAEGKRVARLRLWGDPRRFDEDDRRMLDSLLPQMASSVHGAILDREAKRDPLTGAALRRVLEQRLYELHQKAAESGGSMAVILCDLDHFKRINDTFGHRIGDRALVAVARALDSHRREDDLLARYGGEEFTLVLDRTDGETALAIAERLRRTVEEIELTDDAGQPVPLKLSAGVAAFPELHVKAGDELLVLADGALYEAKRRGRNRCLLDLGQGRYEDPEGNVHEAENRRPSPEPPRLLS